MQRRQMLPPRLQTLRLQIRVLWRRLRMLHHRLMTPPQHQLKLLLRMLHLLKLLPIHLRPQRKRLLLNPGTAD